MLSYCISSHKTCEISPFVEEEDYELYLENFIKLARLNGVIIRSIIYTTDKLQIFVESREHDWYDHIDVRLYDDDGNLQNSL